MATINIFSNQAADGSSLSFVATGNGIPGIKEATRLDIYGEFDGASGQLQFLKNGGDPDNDSDWYSTGDSAFTEPGSFFFDDTNSARAPYRITLTGSGESTSIGATVYNATQF